MIKNIIFDLDGTLLNTIDDLTDAGNWVCKKNNWPTYTVEQFREFVGRGIPYMVEQFMPQEHRTKEGIAVALAQYTARYTAHKEDKTDAYAGVTEMLKKLRDMGINCYVLTNKADALCPPLMQKYFDGLILATLGNRENVAQKPDPAAMALLVKEQKIDKNCTIYVGDSEIDVATAKNSNMQMLTVLWGFRSRETLETFDATNFVETPDDIVEYVKNQNS